ncbi:MAG: methyl-accepting chemotaxis protein [Methylomonas sp.]
MVSLTAMTFNHKLATLSLIPLGGLLLLAGISIEKQIDQIKATQSVIQLANFSVHASALVHELQKERGMSSLYLSSKGQEFGQEVEQQRAITDSKFKELKDFIRASTFASSTSLQESVTTVQKQADELQNTRYGISQLNLSPKIAIDFYTNLNNRFLQIISQLPQLSSDPEMAIKLAAYSNFLKSKERAGIERAVLSSTFANNGFLEGMYEKLIALISAQDTYQEVFLSLAPAEYKAWYEEKATGNPFSETLAMREISLTQAGKGPFGIDPKYWFRMQTAKINIFKEIEDLLAKNVLDTAQRIQTTASQQLTISGLFSLVMIALSILLFWILRKDIANQIGGEPAMVQAIAEKIAAGQIERHTADSNDSSAGIFAAMMAMQKRLSEVISAIILTARQIAQASQEVSGTAQALSQSNCQMAASIEETSATLDHLNDSVEQNRQKAQVTEQIAIQAAASAETGSQAVKETIVAMKKIADKIAVIEDIAYQTNLLSLNASIEAANAGVHGAGFQVVASEVRKLASRSQATATEITELTAENVSISKRAGELLDQTLPHIQKTAILVKEINASSTAQAEGVNQINQAVSQMNKAIQQNAAASEQLAATAEELDDQSQGLMHEIGFFKLK